MFAGLEVSRTAKAGPQAKPSSLSAALSPGAALLRPCGRRSVAFKGSKRAVIKATAAPDAAPEAAPQKGRGQGRGPRTGQRRQREVSLQLEDLRPGQEVTGKVVSVESFGAFVDIGARTDGLVHISQLTDGFVKDTASVIKVGDEVTAKVLTVDAPGNRVALTMKGMRRGAGGDGDDDSYGGDAAPEVNENEIVVDGLSFVVEDDEPVDEYEEFEVVDETGDLPRSEDYITGKVLTVEIFGAFVQFSMGGKTVQGLLHASEMKVPAAKAAAILKAQAGEEGAADAAEDAAEDDVFDDEADEADDAEDFLEDEYVDIGEIADATRVYAVGDEVKAFVLDVDDEGKIQLTQFSDADVGAEDDDDDYEGAELMAQLEAGDVEGDEQDDGTFFDPASISPIEMDYDGEEDRPANRQQLQSNLYESSVSGAISATGSYLEGKRGQFYTPAGFPNRPVRKLRNRALLGNSQMKYTEADDDFDNSLNDLWAVETKLPRNYLRRSGYKFVESEEGIVSLVKRDENKEPSEAQRQAMVDEFLAGVDAATVKDFVDDLLDDTDEEEVPLRAYRAPAVFAATVEETTATISASDVKSLRNKTGAGMMDCKKALLACGGDFEQASEWLRKKGLAGADKKAGRIAAEGVVARYIHPGSRLGVLLEVNCETDFVAASDKFQALVGELGMVIASTDAIVVSADDVPAEVLERERAVEMGKEDIKSKPEAVRAKIVEGRLEKLRKGYALLEQDSLTDPNKKVSEIVKETIAAIGENVQVRRFVKYQLGEGLEKRSNDFAAEVAQQTKAKEAAAAAPAAPKKEEPKKEEATAVPAVQISASAVKQLRDKSGAGMMDCKKALAQCGGDQEAASEWLRKKGLASADKKAGRIAAEGVIAGYIHPGSRLGVLIEVNCETDFVAAGEEFNRLVSNIAMQVAASPGVQFVSASDIPQEVFEREKAIEMGREDLKSKPEAIRAKIAEGRANKIAQEMALLDQPYLMDQSKTVGEAVKEVIATIGENIQIRRFSKFMLGEGIEKKSNDFAAEVAAVTGSN